MSAAKHGTKQLVASTCATAWCDTAIPKKATLPGKLSLVLARLEEGLDEHFGAPTETAQRESLFRAMLSARSELTQLRAALSGHCVRHDPLTPEHARRPPLHTVHLCPGCDKIVQAGTVPGAEEPGESLLVARHGLWLCRHLDPLRDELPPSQRIRCLGVRCCEDQFAFFLDGKRFLCSENFLMALDVQRVASLPREAPLYRDTSEGRRPFSAHYFSEGPAPHLFTEILPSPIGGGTRLCQVSTPQGPCLLPPAHDGDHTADLCALLRRGVSGLALTSTLAAAADLPEVAEAVAAAEVALRGVAPGGAHADRSPGGGAP